MNVALIRPDASRPDSDIFAAARAQLPGTSAVDELRAADFDAFSRLGLPNRRIEQWKYTDLRGLIGDVAPLAGAPDASALAKARDVAESIAGEALRLVIVDGVFVPELSGAPAGGEGVHVRSLAALLAEGGKAVDLLRTRTDIASDATIALNAALATGGVVIDVDDNAMPARPVHIVHVATRTKQSASTRSLVKVGIGARLTLAETFVAVGDASAYQVYDSTVLWIGEGAELQHVRTMEDAADAAHVATAIVTIGAKARFNTFNLTSGGAVSRYQGFITFAGEGAELTTNGVNLLRGRQHGDSTFVITHAVPNCTSREVFRAVVDDRARSVFQGRIIVKPDAQKTDGKMMTRALLLSDEAEVDNKPELEIFADDVTCGHGATAGALDESLLFYLRARGLPEKEAQALLIQAFVGEAIESIVDENLRDAASAAAERWLMARG